MKKFKLNINNNVLILYGKIDFENIVNVIDICINKTKMIKNLIVDFKHLQNSNSSVLLFIINYIRFSIKNKQKIKFINTPTLLMELSKVYNLNNIINNGQHIC